MSDEPQAPRPSNPRRLLPPLARHARRRPLGACVLENGLRLAKTTGAKVEIIQLFAIFHDARRINESVDDGHGRRGAELAAELRGRLFDVSDEDFDLLYEACAAHTDGLTAGELTIRSCWDADRLNLGRYSGRDEEEGTRTNASRWQDMPSVIALAEVIAVGPRPIASDKDAGECSTVASAQRGVQQVFFGLVVIVLK